MKPRGLWVSVEDGGQGWKDLCEAAGYNLEGLSHAYDVRLRRDARVLHLSSAEDIDAFSASYARSPRWSAGEFRSIGWADVARDHQGIIIAPYIWERRRCGRAVWYYGWDCASGCIWDAAAVEAIVPRRPAAAAGEG